MLQNMFDAVSPMHISGHRFRSAPTVVLFDTRTAFPSVSWEWKSAVLTACARTSSSAGRSSRRVSGFAAGFSRGTWRRGRFGRSFVVRALRASHLEPQGSLIAFARRPS